MPKPSLDKQRCHNPTGVGSFLFGSYCRQCSDFDEGAFLENWHPSAFLAYVFINRQLKVLYRKFGGDLVMAMVMGEIWVYNVGRYFDRYGPESATAILSEPEKRAALLPPCNAYSISQVLGVPNETVRRKVKKLVELGMVERGPEGELIATRLSDDQTSPEFVLDFMREFVSTSRHALRIIEDTGNTAAS